ncbi:MAG: LamG domain-containing protein [Victivallales bacterium]|nr:LamG domain-containing protein [Victivallales bacterium]
MIYNRRHFTIIELLFAIAIIAILTAILMPSFNESRARARFVRWLHYNKQCSTDPACVINLNFQEGAGGVLENSAKGHEGEGFNAADYNGIIKGDYQWTSGRWWKGKRAIQFDGVSTYIEFLKDKHIDFDGKSNFTIIIWVKFDILNNWNGIFGKCYMKNENVGYAQYTVYYKGTKGSPKHAAGQFELDIGNESVIYDDVNAFSPGGQTNYLDWFQLVLRNKFVGETEEVHLFFNGKQLQSDHVSTKGFKTYKCKAKLAIGCIRWLLVKDEIPDNNGKPGNFLKGKVDEFQVYNRALSNSEINANYVMGASNF